MRKILALALVLICAFSNNAEAAFRTLGQYKITTTGAASTSKAMPEYATIISLGRIPQVVLYATGTDIIYKMDDVSVTAAATVTSSKLAAGNVLIPAGAVYQELAGGNISIIAADSASTGYLWVRIGYDDHSGE